MSQDDHRDPGSLVAAMYEVISGPADEPRDWERFRALFHDGARFLIHTAAGEGEGPSHGEWDVEGFVEAASEEYRQDGFWEREIHARTDRFGNVAHVFSTYETRVGSPDAEPVGRGVNSIQCLRVDGRWRIVHLVFDVESEDVPIPAEYLPPE